MAKKKYYAVVVGRTTGIYQTWDQCEEQTEGVSGAKYQRFDTFEQAEQYIMQQLGGGDSVQVENPTKTRSEQLNAEVEGKVANLNTDEIIAFVDGSYDVAEEKSAFGAIIFSHGSNKDVLYKAFTKHLGEEFISLRNVAAELEGVKEAISWAIKYNKRKIEIYYDYEGIEKWANGEWSAKKAITKDYVKFIRQKESVLEIKFVKVPAHMGVKFNEEVDALAKGALLAKGHKTYNDGSVYFVGYGVEDWETIVQCINDENMALPVEEKPCVEMTREMIGTRQKIKLQQDSATVTINCYHNSKSYVQGKQTSLFQKIISTAIGFLDDKQKAIETLNSYYALMISEMEVENRFEELLPHYTGAADKNYYNLLSAVYNTMVVGYMPDYTCLVTPIFRAYEYYLHRILGDVMGLDTETDRGTNNFAFFSKNTEGFYECNSRTKSVLSDDQLNYLNSLYTKYNAVRHPYSHWSASDAETAVIVTINVAQDHLLEGLGIIDRYYTMFS